MRSLNGAAFYNLQVISKKATLLVFNKKGMFEEMQNIYNSNGELLDMQPQDGFYSFTGNQLGYGIEGKFKLNNRLDMFFDWGIIDYLSKYTKGFDSMMYGQVPFYMDVRFDYKFSKLP